MHLELLFLYIAYFEFFRLRINKLNMHNNIGLNDRFGSTGRCFKSKVIEGSHMEKYVL